MVAIISPRIAAARPLTSDSPVSEAMTLRPENAEREIGRRPERSARRDSGSVSSTSISRPNRLPITPD